MWETRFQTPDYVFGKAPARFLPDHATYFTPGLTALSVADGEGRNSVYLAQQGLCVTALEFAPSAIAKARALAQDAGVDIDIHEADVIADPFPVDGPFDITLGIFIQFVGPQERAALFEKMARATAPGGVLMLHGYTPKQLDYGTGGPRALENLYTPDLLAGAFSGWEILENRAHERELDEGKGHSGRSALIDFIARKPV